MLFGRLFFNCFLPSQPLDRVAEGEFLANEKKNVIFNFPLPIKRKILSKRKNRLANVENELSIWHLHLDVSFEVRSEHVLLFT